MNGGCTVPAASSPSLDKAQPTARSDEGGVGPGRPQQRPRSPSDPKRGSHGCFQPYLAEENEIKNAPSGIRLNISSSPVKRRRESKGISMKSCQAKGLFVVRGVLGTRGGWPVPGGSTLAWVPEGVWPGLGTGRGLPDHLPMFLLL